MVMANPLRQYPRGTAPHLRRRPGRSRRRVGPSASAGCGAGVQNALAGGRSFVTLPVLILSMMDESLYAERGLRAGANGYIMKQQATEQVLVAIRRILGGEIYVSERMANKMLHLFVGGSPAEESSPVADLTDRELEVFRLIGEGHGTRQIADELHLSIKTVESYQAHIKEKLNFQTARELARFAVQWVDQQAV